MRPFSRAAGLVLLISATLLAACDSGDPIDTPDPAEVAGLYAFDELSFRPDGAGIQPVNLLDTLRAQTTLLRLSSSGVFFLDYEFVGGTPYFVRGTFEVSPRIVRLKGEREDRDEYRRLLLDDEILLYRTDDDPDVLTATVQKTVNLAAFSPERYAGVTSAPGTLRIRLVRQ